MPLSDYPDNTSRATMITRLGDFTVYPDDLQNAIDSFEPTMRRFRQLANSATDSAGLLSSINLESLPLRTQLLRVFRWMVSKATPVELLKKKRREAEIIRDYGAAFTPINDLRNALLVVTDQDPALAFMFWQYQDRGTSGYMLTDETFTWIENNLPDIEIVGPRGAGRDPPLSEFLMNSDSTTPVDFALYQNLVINGEPTRTLVAVGWARYDSDRGGSQGDDRVGVNIDHAQEIIAYNNENNTNIKVIFVNDGIGLIIGEMWDEYSRLEDLHDNVRVMTLRMMANDLSLNWLTQ